MRLPPAALLLLTAACATTSASTPPGGEPHKHPSGLEFPAQVGGLALKGVKVYDQQGQDVGASYTFVAIANQRGSDEHLASALQQAWDFPDARAVVERRRSSVLVSDLMSSGLDHRERLDLFQRALRAVLDTEKAEAIYWRASDRLVDARSWVHAFDGGNPAQLFFAGAVNVRSSESLGGDAAAHQRDRTAPRPGRTQTLDSHPSASPGYTTESMRAF